MLLDKQSGRSRINAWLFLEREEKGVNCLLGDPAVVWSLCCSRGRWAVLGCCVCMQGGLECCEQMVCVGHTGQSRQGTGADWWCAGRSQHWGGDGELGRQWRVLLIQPQCSLGARRCQSWSGGEGEHEDAGKGVWGPETQCQGRG